MEDIIIYLLKVNAVLSLMFIVYFLFMRKENNFQLMRLVFISMLALSFLIPCLPSIKKLFTLELQENDLSYKYNKLSSAFVYKNYNDLTNYTIEGKSEKLLNKNTIETTFPVLYYGSIMYIIVSGLLTAWFIFSILRLVFLLNSSRLKEENGIIYCEIENNSVPFSFFNYMVIVPTTITQYRNKEIEAHEKVHITQWHSLDIILIEITICLLWINPLLILLRRYIKLNLEYIADEEVVKNGVDKIAYQKTILSFSLISQRNSLINLFNSPKIKQRIIMMNANHTSGKKIYKFLLILPAVVISSFLFGSVSEHTVTNEIAQLQSKEKFDNKDLKIFEGYYVFQFDKGKDVYINISSLNGRLVLKELFSGNSVEFDQKTELEFYNKKHSFDLSFSLDNHGKVENMTAFRNDVWKRVKDIPSDEHVFNLNASQTENIEGYYQASNNKDAVINLSLVNNKLVWKSLWNNFEIAYSPKSELEFFIKEIDINNNIQFLKDNEDNIVGVVQKSNDLHWKKIKNYSPAKEIDVAKDVIKKYEGDYVSESQGKIAKYKISSKNGNLILTELWKGGNQFILIPVSDTRFFSNQGPFSIEFKEERGGRVKEVFLHGLLSVDLLKKFK